jgi:hypothetical protein
MLAALVQDGGWGGRLLLPQGGPFYLSGTIRFPQIAGQELIGQGARSTRFVWRGPDDLPAFDFTRCQDCGLGHFSLEVGERVGTDKSVSLTRSGATATVTATDHGFTVGQFVYIFGPTRLPQRRHVVTTASDADVHLRSERPSGDARDGDHRRLAGSEAANGSAFLQQRSPAYWLKGGEGPVVEQELPRAPILQVGRTSPRRRPDRLGPHLYGGAGQERPPPPDERPDQRATSNSGIVFQGDQPPGLRVRATASSGADWG